VIDDTLGIPSGWTIQIVALASVAVAAALAVKRWF